MKRDTYFDNKVIWITGASSGIGLEMAKQLDLLGAKLILSSRNIEALNTLKTKLSSPEKHFVCALDLEKSSEFEKITQSIIEKYSKIDILINNGGISQRANAMKTSLEVDRKIMEVNYFGNIALSKCVLPYMLQSGRGQIVVVSSIAGKFGFYLRSAYSASKHALHGFYESLAMEEFNNGIRVTMVCPAKINTPISVNAINEKGTKSGIMDNNQRKGMPVSTCVKKIIRAIKHQKHEVIIGGEGVFAIKLKAFIPSLFRKLIRKQSAT